MYPGEEVWVWVWLDEGDIEIIRSHSEELM